ncbi:hypothetical protein [Bordetella genomosp. 5]|uniref:hypothetical protein n=1 Tax=Bordetella genomosp. 5 TaxID=1395608 RepID=UPI00113FF440|nr:hypothetical protein [Bordetella genomosp. 5]
MSSTPPSSEPGVLAWRAASRKSGWKWPAILGVGALIAGAINGLTSVACLGGILAFATFPVWYYVTGRVARGQPRPALVKQWLASIVLLLVGTALSPSFQVYWLNTWGDPTVSTFLTKRSLLESVRQPFYSLDELAWGQNSASVDVVPSTLLCPRYSLRRYPLLTIERRLYPMNPLASSRDRSGGKPPAELVASTLARCEADSQAMIAAGLTKEAALAQGNLDLFFERALIERGNDMSPVMLEDADIPAEILAKVEAFLGEDPERIFWHTSYNLSGEDPVKRADKSDAPGTPDVVRRLRTIAFAAAYGRQDVVEVLKERSQ